MRKELIMPLMGPLGLVGGIFILDRVTKAWRFSLAPEAFPLPGILELSHHINKGLIANIAVPPIPVILFTVIIAIGLFVFLLKHAFLRLPDTYALACILGGALGNIYDRIIFSFVFDWILLFRTSLINIADIAITFGVLWYIYLIRRQSSLDDMQKKP